MKDFNICPKCNSQDILRITNQCPANMLLTGTSVFSAIYLTCFVCANCGYSEQWIESPEDLEKLRKVHKPATPIVPL